MARSRNRQRGGLGSLASVVALALASVGLPAAAATPAVAPPYTHVAISEESICVSYTADFVRAVIALAKSNEVSPTQEMIDQVKLAADQLSVLVAQAPADFTANLTSVRAAFTEGHRILISGTSGRFSDPEGSRAQLLAYITRCQRYPLTTLPGELRPPDPSADAGASPAPGSPTVPTPNPNPGPIGPTAV